MGNRTSIEHEIALIEKIHEYLLNKLNEYKKQGVITQEQLELMKENENNSFKEMIEFKQSFIWGD